VGSAENKYKNFGEGGQIFLLYDRFYNKCATARHQFFVRPTTASLDNFKRHQDVELGNGDQGNRDPDLVQHHASKNSPQESDGEQHFDGQPGGVEVLYENEEDENGKNGKRTGFPTKTSTNTGVFQFLRPKVFEVS
jgi:hypothetical protein